jgi:hypothetical protein
VSSCLGEATSRDRNVMVQRRKVDCVYGWTR